jgi:hypothetical protein
MEINIRTGTNVSQLAFPVKDIAHKILPINGSIEEYLIEN